MPGKYLFFLTASLLAATPALAQDDVAQPAAPAVSTDAQITVLATGSKLRLDQTGQAVTVITADQIAQVQGADLTRLLERVPGLTFSRNGGLGTFTGVRLRGSEAEQVLVLIDGVRVEDVSSPSGGYDFGNLLTGGIDRIDVLRGSNSVVWGSAAIGGVIVVTTKEVNGAEASVEYGAKETVSADAVAGVANDRYAFSLNGGYARTDGVSAAAVGTEPDGYRQWRIGGRGRVNLTPDLSLNAVARYADSKLDIDGYPPPTYTVFGDTPEYQKTRQFSGRAGFHYAGSALTLDGGYALADTRRNYYDPTYGADPQYGYKGRSQRVDLTGRIALPPHFALDFGGDSEWTRFSSSFDAQRSARLSSGHALLGWYTDRASLAAGVRVDDHSRFGTQATFGANGSVRVAQGLRLRASYGEGFKAPTLYQLYSDYGNQGLSPERSRSYDAGVEYTTADGVFHASATWFRRDTRNLIAYVSCFSVTSPLCADGRFGFYDNVGKTRAEGVELELRADVSPTFRAQAVYTYDLARNLTVADANYGKALARRPRNALTLSADWTSPLAGLTFGADVRLVSDSFDDAGNRTRLDGYELTTLRASLPFGDFFELFGRVENLFDEKYQTSAGYGTWGRSAFIGARVRY